MAYLAESIAGVQLLEEASSEWTETDQAPRQSEAGEAVAH